MNEITMNDIVISQEWGIRESNSSYMKTMLQLAMPGVSLVTSVAIFIFLCADVVLKDLAGRMSVSRQRGLVAFVRELIKSGMRRPTGAFASLFLSLAALVAGSEKLIDICSRLDNDSGSSD